MKRWMACLAICVSLIFGWSATGNAAEETVLRDYRQVVYELDSEWNIANMTCILQDERGYLWIGSKTGVVRCDGTTFERIGEEESPQNITCMLLKEGEEVWIGTQEDGIYVYQGQRFISHIQDEAISSELQSRRHITAMAKDSTGTVYVGTDDGVFYVDMDNIVWWLEEEELLTSVQSLICLSDDSLCVLSDDGNLYHLRNGGIQTLSIALDEGEVLNSLSFHDTSDFYYVGTNKNHLYQISRMGSVNEIIETGEMEYIHDEYVDALGRMWIAGRNGVGYLQGDEVVYPKLQLHGEVTALFEDMDGNLWILFAQRGLLKLSPSFVEQLTEENFFEENVTALTEWNDLIWIGTEQGLYTWSETDGVQAVDLGRWNEETIRALQVYEDALWIAGENGIAVMQSDGTMEIRKGMDSAANCLAVLDDAVWIGTDSGIWQYKDGLLQEYVSGTKLDECDIIDFAVWEDKVYVGTANEGVFMVCGEQTTYLNQELSSHIYAVQVNPNTGEVWVLTNRGFACEEEGQWNYRTDLPYSFTNFVFSQTGDLWMTGHSVLVHSSAQQVMQKDYCYSRYTTENALSCYLTGTATPYLNQEGELFLAGQDRVLRIQTKQAEELPTANIQVTRVEIDGNLRFVEGGRITIHNQQQVLELALSNVSYSSDEFVPYCYLEGVDEEKVRLTDTGKVRYTNLKGGTYTLHYGCYDVVHGTYSEQGQVKVVKAYTFWENPYLRGGIISIFVLIGIVIVICLYRQMEKRVQRQYEMRHKEEEETQLRTLAYQDYVTGCENRSSWKKRQREIEANEVLLRSTGILTVSIDNIRQSNQLFGEDSAEVMLKQCAGILREIHGVMNEDIFYIRAGIFLIMLSSQRDGNEILCQLREKMDEWKKEFSGKIYISSGFAFFEANRDGNVNDILTRSWEMLEIERKKQEKEKLTDSIELS